MDVPSVFFKRAKNGIYVCVCGKYCDTDEEALYHVDDSYIEGFCEGGIRRNMKDADRLKDEYECVCGKKADWYDITHGHQDIFKTSCVTDYLRKINSYCQICDLQCISVYDYKLHCNTLKHRNRKDGYASLQLRCDICKITFPSQGHIRRHLETKKHKDMVASGEIADERISLTCDICKITCPSQKTIRAHLQTKKHKKLLSVNNVCQGIDTQ